MVTRKVLFIQGEKKSSFSAVRNFFFRGRSRVNEYAAKQKERKEA